MDSPQRQGLDPVSISRHRTATLFVAAAGSVFGAITELQGLIDGLPGAWARLAAYVLIGLASAFQLLRGRRTEAVLGLSALCFGLLSLIETTQMTGLDTGITLAFLILLAVVFVTTRQSKTRMPLVLASGMIAVYTVITVILEQQPASQAAGRLLVGIPGQILVVWITWRLIHSLEMASLLEARRARIQEALTTCSQALLTGRDQEPLTAALKALLDATEADYAYVDVNRVDGEGHITWEIVADAEGDNVPPGPDSFGEGDYTHFPGLVEKLSAGQPARILVSQLSEPIRARYEAEGIKSDLMAPIMIRGQWVGTLGYSDFWREDAWTDVEVDGLTRAADMVAAYWERESAREGLEELAEAKDRFIATVSHELRTPLSAIVGFSGELSQGLAGYTREEILEMVRLISSQSVEMARLVDDLLTAERAASGNLTVRPGAIDLLEESQSVVESLGVKIDVSFAGPATTAWADRFRTRQIMRNLLTNAQRYGGPKVRIELASRDDLAVLAVCDDGHGVSGIDAEHIFDPYYRSRSENTRPESVGLGLAVARQLARVMDGDLVYQRHAGWTRFELTLPTASSPVPALVG